MRDNATSKCEDKCSVCVRLGRGLVFIVETHPNPKIDPNREKA